MTRLDCCGTHKENMLEIDNAPISEGFKEFVKKELREHFDGMDDVPDYISGWGCKKKCCNNTNGENV